MRGFIICILRAFLFIFYRVKIHNIENLNSIKGKCIICSNHISNLDPVILLTYSKRNIRFMAKKELFEVKIIKKIIGDIFGAFPVDRDNPGMSTIRQALSILKDEKILGIFPEGTRVKNGYNENNAKSGVAMIANKSQAQVLPIYIKSSYKLFGKVDIVIGNPRNYFEDIEGRVTSDMYVEISKQMLKDIYNLEYVISEV